MINEEQKQSKIESLEEKAFSNLMISLLSKIGYSDIKLVGKLILATFNGPMNRDTHGFLIIQEKLSGNVELSRIKRLFNAEKEGLDIFTAFIVSPYHISKGFIENFKSEVKI